MARRLFTVEDTFMVKGRGLVSVPDIIPQGEEVFRVGDALLLKRPDGSAIHTTIDGLELLNPNPNNQVVVLVRFLKRDDIPVGTDVWTVE